MESVKVRYGDFKISIRPIKNYWWLDFYYKKKRIRRSTNLYISSENLTTIKEQLIPEVITALTSNAKIESFKKDLTLNEFAIQFFETYKGTVREHVYKKRKHHYDLKIKPTLSNINLNELLPIQLEKWQLNLLKNHKNNTVNAYRSVLYSILEKALNNDLIKYNPLKRVESPLSYNKGFKKLNEEDEDDINPFNKNEIKSILSNTKGNLYYFILIMLYSGMRPGEIISLNWNDINFKKKQIAVYKTTVYGVVGDVKTESSVRYVDILPQLEVKLKELKKITDNYDSIIVNQSNKPFYSHDVLNIRFRKILGKTNIKDRTIYNLRHTFASQMISKIGSGIDILWVSKTLGHKDVSVTLQKYAKYIVEDDKIRIKNINKIGTILGTF